MTDWINTCQVCGAEESLDALIVRMIDDAVVRGLVHDVLKLSLPLGSLLVRYIRLHKPPKQRLRATRLRELVAELVTDMQRNVVERHGRTWAVSIDDWRGAFDAVFTAVDRGTLQLPLQGNGYLYQVLTRKSDQAEAAQEAQREQQRRTAPRADTVQVKGQALPIGEALQVAYAGKDPVLAKLDADARNATPMPADVRQREADLRTGPRAATTHGALRVTDVVPGLVPLQAAPAPRPGTSPTVRAMRAAIAKKQDPSA